ALVASSTEPVSPPGAGWATTRSSRTDRTANLRSSLRGERCEQLEAGDAFERRPYGRQRDGLSVREIGPEALVAYDPRVAEGQERPRLQLPLAQPHADVALDHLQRAAGRREEELPLAPADPERPAGASGDVDGARAPPVDPGRRERARQLLERARVVVGV